MTEPISDEQTPTPNWRDDWEFIVRPSTAAEQNQPVGHPCEFIGCVRVAVVVAQISLPEESEGWFVCLPCAVATAQQELTNIESAPNGWSGLSWCRVCRCTDNDCSGCIERTGQPCRWVEPDVGAQANLCSACA